MSNTILIVYSLSKSWYVNVNSYVGSVEMFVEIKVTLSRGNLYVRLKSLDVIVRQLDIIPALRIYVGSLNQSFIPSTISTISVLNKGDFEMRLDTKLNIHKDPSIQKTYVQITLYLARFLQLLLSLSIISFSSVNSIIQSYSVIKLL